MEFSWPVQHLLATDPFFLSTRCARSPFFHWLLPGPRQRPAHAQRRRLQRVPGVVKDSPWWRHSAEERLRVYDTLSSWVLTLLLPQFPTLPWYSKKHLEKMTFFIIFFYLTSWFTSPFYTVLQVLTLNSTSGSDGSLSNTRNWLRLKKLSYRDTLGTSLKSSTHCPSSTPSYLLRLSTSWCYSVQKVLGYYFQNYAWGMVCCWY